MAANTALIAELKHEGANTKKILERVPTNKLSWAPHEKSMKIGRLAKHVADLNVWVERIMNTNEFNFATANINREAPENTEAILKLFDERLASATQVLESSSDEDFSNTWKVFSGRAANVSTAKKVALRSFAYNHIYHHRGQLSVYLRLLNVPVPGMYGPSADESM